MSPNPSVLVNGLVPPQLVTAGAAMTVSLANIAGVSNWNLSILSTDDSAPVHPTITINQATFVATFTMTGAGTALLMQSTVNNNLDSTGLFHPEYTTTFKVGVRSLDGYQVYALGEQLESGPYGWLPAINRAASSSFIASGDLSGNNSVQTVIGLQTNSILAQSLGASQDGYILTWHNAGPYWEALPAPSGFTAGGDLSGTSTSQNVIKIHGTSVPATPSANQVLTATSGTTAVWQQIADAEISPTAAIQVSKLNNGGAGGQIIVSQAGTFTPTWQSVSGDISLSGAGVVVVTAIQRNNVDSTSLGAGQDGFVLTWVNSTSKWTAQAITSGSVTLAGDVTGPATSNTVGAIQGNTVTSGALVKGNLLIATTTSNWASTAVTGDISFSTSTPGLTSVVGIESIPIVLTSLSNTQILQYNGTNWVNANPPGGPPSGAAGGDLSGFYPNPTVVQAQGGDILFTTTAIEFAAAVVNPSLLQLSTSAGATSSSLTIQAQNNTHATSTGGNAVITSGTGTSADGYVVLQIGGQTGAHYLELAASGAVTIADLGLGVVHSSAAGLLTSSLIVNADVSASAAIAYSKLNLTNSIVNADINSAAAIAYSKLNLTGDIVNADISTSAAIAVSKLAIGTADQLLDTNHGATTAEWFTLGGDATFASHNLTVTGIQGNTFTSGAPTKGQFVVATTASNYGPVSLSGDVTDSATTAGSITVVGIQGNTFTSGSPTKGQFVMATSTTNYGPVTLSGDLSESSSTAGLITVVGIQGNTVTSGGLTKGQFFVASSTSNWAATTLSGDISESSSTAGLLTVVGIQGNTFTSGSPTKGQFVVATSTTNYGPVTISGDVSESAVTAGLLTVTGLQGISVPSPSGSNTVLTYNSGAYSWASGGGGGITALTGDVTASGTGSVAATVVSITGGSGVVNIASSGNVLTWAAATTAPGFAQTAPASGSGAGTAGATMTQTAQAGGATTGSSTTGGAGGAADLVGGAGGSGSGGTNASGGAGGNVVLNSGTGGAKSGSGTVGANGNISLQLGGTELISISGATVGNITFTNTAATPNITQTAPASSSSAGTAGNGMTHTSQAGGATTGSATTAGAGGNNSLVAGAGGSGSGGTNANGGAGGEAIISSGAGGANSGSGTIGANGAISLQLGGTELINISGSTLGNITFTNTSAVINITQTGLASTSSGAGSNASGNTTIAAQDGQSTTNTGAASSGGNGSLLFLKGGTGGSSSSSTSGGGNGGGVSINGQAGGAANGTANTGGTGGTVTVQGGTGGSGAGGTNANGGPGGNVVIRPGTGAAKSGSGTVGANGTTILEDGSGSACLTIGGSGIQYNTVSVAISTGTTTLTAAQYSRGYIILTGSLSGSVTLVLPATKGAQWIIDATAVTLNAHTITLQANSVSWATTIGTTNIYDVTYGGTGKLYGTALTP